LSDFFGSLKWGLWRKFYGCLPERFSNRTDVDKGDLATQIVPNILMIVREEILNSTYNHHLLIYEYFGHLPDKQSA
jgi:hypothetical protein